MTPKAFISYSHTNPQHQELVRSWAEQLASDGVDIILDQYELKEGQDKYAFMERMVTDETVTHVLILSDKKYAEKADNRTAGVGTESQIISKEIYDKVDQSKFIPLVCEFDENGSPYLPVFLRSRIWINFSNPEAVNENWERLVRLLYGKPLLEKPSLGKPPTYIREDTQSPSSPAISKFNMLRQALMQQKRGINLYRDDFIEACIDYADRLRTRARPDVQILGEKVLADCKQLSIVRNHIVDWVLLESHISASEEFSESILSVLEQLLELRSKPSEMNSWNEAWFEAHRLFVYETFLYIIAALIKRTAFNDVHNILTSHYLLPESESRGDNRFVKFDEFYAHSDTLQEVLAPKDTRLFSPAAELIKRQADRDDIPLRDIIQADLVVLLLAFITPDANWYPQTLLYAGYNKQFPLFVRAAQHKHFKKIVHITGVKTADELRERVKEAHERLQVNRWTDFSFHCGVSLWNAMNMDRLDSIT